MLILYVDVDDIEFMFFFATLKKIGTFGDLLSGRRNFWGRSPTFLVNTERRWGGEISPLWTTDRWAGICLLKVISLLERGWQEVSFMVYNLVLSVPLGSLNSWTTGHVVADLLHRNCHDNAMVKSDFWSIASQKNWDQLGESPAPKVSTRWIPLKVTVFFQIPGGPVQNCQEQQRSNLDALVRREQHLAEQCPDIFGSHGRCLLKKTGGTSCWVIDHESATIWKDFEEKDTLRFDDLKSLVSTRVLIWFWENLYTHFFLSNFWTMNKIISQIFQ